MTFSDSANVHLYPSLRCVLTAGLGLSVSAIWVSRQVSSKNEQKPYFPWPVDLSIDSFLSGRNTLQIIVSLDRIHLVMNSSIESYANFPGRQQVLIHSKGQLVKKPPCCSFSLGATQNCCVLPSNSKNLPIGPALWQSGLSP